MLKEHILLLLSDLIVIAVEKFERVNFCNWEASQIQMKSGPRVYGWYIVRQYQMLFSECILLVADPKS
jgi:hypothetical protein